MKGYIENIEKVTLKNTDYRRVIYTGQYSQLVVMSLPPGVEIGNEVHELDQFLRIEAGEGKVIFNNGQIEKGVSDGFAIIVPAGTYHNIINTGQADLKLYTIYSPPAHLRNTLQATKAEEVEDHFDGHTSEN